MLEHTLDELKKLALPALRHAELVGIARTESPNKAQQLASIRWPTRQAKATRFLAMVARDYGLGVFDALISSLEHARPAGSEHAQEVTMSAKLDFDLYPENVPNVLMWLQGNGEGVENIALLHIIEKEQPRILKFEDEVARLGLDTEGRKMLIRRVINGMLTHWAKLEAKQFRYGEAWDAARVAAKMYLPEDGALAKKLVLATVAYQGGAEKHQNGLIRCFFEGAEANTATLQDVINKLLSWGYTEDEVLEAWGILLEVRYRNNFHTAGIYGFVEKLTIGKKLVARTAFPPVAAKCVARELKYMLMNGPHDSGWKPTLADEWWLVMMDHIVHATTWGKEKVDHEAFEEWMAHCIARGALGVAAYVFQRYGPALGMWDSINGPEKLKEKFEKFMRGAKDKAIHDLKQFGVASALAEQLGEEEEADSLRVLARCAKQKVAINAVFYYRNDTVR